MIADELNKLKQTKAQIKQALIDKGQNPTDEFASYVGNIAGISGGDPFLELGYPMPKGMNNLINKGLEFKESWNPNNTSASSQGQMFLPVGMDFNKVKYFYMASDLWYVPRLDLPVANDSQYSFNNALYVELGTMPDREMTIKFGQNCTKVVINEPIKIKYSYYNTPFRTCYALEEIVGLDKINTSAMTEITETFYQCKSLKGELDLRNFDVSNATKARQFLTESKVSKVDISNWDTSKITDMYYMFYNNSNLQEILLPDNFGSASKTFNCMFSGCDLRSIDGTKFNTSSVNDSYDFNSMFSNNKNIEEIDISSWDMSNANNVSYMFSYCVSLKRLYLPQINPNITQYSDFIRNCNSLEYIRIPDGFTHKVPILTNSAPNIVAVDGSIDMSTYKSNGGYAPYVDKLRKVTYKNLGAEPSGNYIAFRFDWGVEDPNNPLTQGARQSVIDSLITYSFDRAAAGYSPQTFYLKRNTTSQLLTEAEIAEMTAKGFNIMTTL